MVRATDPLLKMYFLFFRTYTFLHYLKDATGHHMHGQKGQVWVLSTQIDG